MSRTSLFTSWSRFCSDRGALHYTCSKVLLDARVCSFHDAIRSRCCRTCASACPQLTRSTNTIGGMKRPPNDRCCSAVSRLHRPHMGWMGLFCPVLEQILRCLGQKIYEHIAASAYTSNTCMIGHIIRTCLTWSTLGRNGSRATREPKTNARICPLAYFDRRHDICL